MVLFMDETSRDRSATDEESRFVAGQSHVARTKRLVGTTRMTRKRDDWAFVIVKPAIIFVCPIAILIGFWELVNFGWSGECSNKTTIKLILLCAYITCTPCFCSCQ